MSIYRTISPLTYGYPHLNRDLETIDLTTLTALTSKKMQRMIHKRATYPLVI